MKTIMTLLMFFALCDAYAFELKVSKMTRASGYTGRYELKTNSPEKVVLDCQSFLQGLLFGEHGTEGVLLQEWECEELMTDMKKSLGRSKKYCLEVNEDEAVIVSQQECK